MKLHYIILLALICEVVVVRPRLLLTQKSADEQRPQSEQTKRLRAQQYTVRQNPSVSDVSLAPLFYHISPGSTGSRTLYHAACSAGFPSVHHKSFCISSSRGIAGVENEVVDGVRAHYEVLRLYEMASQCLSLKNKGRLSNDEIDYMQVMTLCNTTVDEWANNLQYHLAVVIQSGLVGLFDTPYPYLAPQVLKLTNQWRSHTIIGMTERDPTSWARSRIKHGLLLCRAKYSLDLLGSSEFDVLGCISRAKNSSDGGLHLWDVFWYRSHHEDADSKFMTDMERQMEKHQRIYLPRAGYTPNFFRVDPKTDKQAARVDEKDVAKDMRKLLLPGKNSQQQPLKCRGRVNWDITNDTFLEVYHLPKTCAPSNKEKRGDPIPLIQPVQ